MAKDPEPAAPGAAKPSKAAAAIAFVLVTVIAAGAGAGYATLVKPPGSAAAVVAASKPEPAPHGSGHGGGHQDAAAGEQLRPLPNIVTSLQEPKTVWMRLESSILLEPMPAPDADRLTREITGDFLAFARTLTLAQVEGASGLQHLREDLTERASVRSGGKVREVVLQSLVLQ